MASLRAIRDNRPDPTPLIITASIYLPWLIKLPMTASIAVAWHRLILRRERPANWKYLRFDRIVIGYALMTLAFELIEEVSILLTRLTIGGAIFPLAAVYLYFTARLAVWLPAKALDRQEITLAEVWRRTRGNGWRLAFGNLLTLLPFILIKKMTLWLAPPLVSNVAVAVGDSIHWMLGLTIYVGFLSFAYQHFFEPDPNQLIQASLLSPMIERMVYATSGDKTRYNLNGMYFEFLPDTGTADTKRCPQCGTVYQPSEYREDIEHWYCSACDHELPRER